MPGTQPCVGSGRDMAPRAGRPTRAVRVTASSRVPRPDAWRHGEGVLAAARTIHQSRARGFYAPAMSRRRVTERVSTAIRLPIELHAELQRQASEREVSVNFLVTRAVDHYLRELRPADPLVTRTIRTER